MLKGAHIICTANTTWHGNYTKSTVQLCTRLAKDNHVYFVSYPYTWKDVLQALIGRKKLPLGRIFGSSKRAIAMPSDDARATVTEIILPPMLPFAFAKGTPLFAYLLAFNTAVYRFFLVRQYRKLGIERPIVLNAYNPLYGYGLLGRLKETFQAYYCYDITETYRYGDDIVPFEHEFIKKAALVITTSEQLQQEKQKLNPKTYLVKNGVDTALFLPFAKTAISQGPQKKVGYIGSLDNRFALDIMSDVVAGMPNIQFEFTGPVRNPAIVSRLSRFQNVVFQPSVLAHEVPAHLAGYDVAIIPYVMNEQNRNIYPLKINEYLAIGLPVVITDFAPLTEFGELVFKAKSPASFIAALKTALRNDGLGRIAKRKAFAKANGWDERAQQLSGLLETARREQEPDELVEPSAWQTI